MSQHNLEIAKRGIDAFNATDVDAFTAVSELLKATLFGQESSRLPYNQSYQFITELQRRSLN